MTEMGNQSATDVSAAPSATPVEGARSKKNESTGLDVSTIPVDEAKARDRDLHRMRMRYSRNLFFFVALWMVAVLFFLWIKTPCCHPPSDAVLITLLTTTTANVLALLVFVIKWLFPNEKNGR